MANSLAGAIIRAYGPSSINSPYIGGILDKKLINGTRKAADFPDPVGANPIISLKLSPIGIPCI